MRRTGKPGIAYRNFGQIVADQFYFKSRFMMRFYLIALVWNVFYIRQLIGYRGNDYITFLQRSKGREGSIVTRLTATKNNYDPIDQAKARNKKIVSTGKTIDPLPKDKTIPTLQAKRPKKAEVFGSTVILDSLSTQSAINNNINPINITLSVEELQHQLSETLPQKLLLSFVDSVLYNRLWRYFLYVTFVFASLLLWLGYFSHQANSPLPELDVSNYLLLLPIDYGIPYLLVQRWQEGYDDVSWFSDMLKGYIQQQKKNAEILLKEEESRLSSIVSSSSVGQMSEREKGLVSAAVFRLASSKVVAALDEDKVFKQVLIRRGVDSMESIIKTSNSSSIRFEDLQSLQQMLVDEVRVGK